MLKNKNELTVRTLFALILVAFFIPIFIIAKYGGQNGRIVTSVAYMIVGMYAVFEVLMILKVTRNISFITALCVPLFFIFPFENYQSIIRLHEGVNYLNILAKRAIGSLEGWLITLIFSFMPFVLLFQKANSINANKQLIITAILIIIPSFAKLFWAYNIKGLEVSVFFILIPVISDIGGYFGGKFFGTKWFNGKKLAPTISPKKTYAGFVIGTMVSTIFAILYGYFANIWSDFKSNELLVSFIFGILLALFATVGDLFFSIIKRLMGAKDFSNIIPGHGGLMDRLDSISIVFFLSGVFLLFVFN